MGMATMAAVIILCLPWAYKHVRGAHEEHNGRIASQMEEKRTYETMRATSRATEAAARKLAALQQTAAVATRPAPTEEIWHGLVNPQKYPITLSTTISERIPRPAGFSTRMEPSGLPYELWANGVLLPKTPGVSTGIPIGTTYVQYRWTNPTPTNVVVGVGREVK